MQSLQMVWIFLTHVINFIYYRDLDLSFSNDVVEKFQPESVLNVFGSVNVSGNYFNSVKKCWEPLLERVVGSCLFEQVRCIFSVDFTL